ncbi:uncharacterized protein TRIADDRAFT_55844 [Trichoplax adhaerens]|uniref:UDENN FNIP1/2-type domain-containing protein n=1 Tax=Trichoplax adhaerens TaxID=10228 RepID=B3RW08_TRIAD|nr:hypothetical protein TRIADDRAFT_55844 [Trichoplax adhaerens]EDV26092.1 hypothetical protein TRIADDRAFT_55844 [Trichoplax adhaerens]|eukprot:XP_002112125.1 hypothetical protein TRIADDRAFT_55844 [Trichoplax adhaerens]
MLSKIAATLSFSHKEEQDVILPSPPFDEKQIRILIFQEDHHGQKSLLLDTGKNGRRFPSDGNQGNQINSDIKMFKEIMFGSVAVKIDKTTVKVHEIRIPPQLLVTKVFTLDRIDNKADDTSSKSSYARSSLDELRVSSRPLTSKSMSTSILRQGLINIPARTGRRDSGFGESSSLKGSYLFYPQSPATFHGSYQRRLFRNKSTSLEFGFSEDNSQIQEAENSPNCSNTRRRKLKLAVGIIFNLWDDSKENACKIKSFKRFFFSHFMVLESHINRLKEIINRNFDDKSNFYAIITEAVTKFKNTVCQLYSAIRMPEPVWLNLLAMNNQRDEICSRFVDTLVQMVERFNEPKYNFFISKLITAVLRHHLAWVSTVAPDEKSPYPSYYDKRFSVSLNELARSLPYNPVWAQLGDLYGSVGSDTRICRTIVVGKNAPVVRNILYLLSYFIRCSEIYEDDEITIEWLNEIDDERTLIDAECKEKKAPLLKLRAYSENCIHEIVKNPVKEKPLNAADAAIELAEKMIAANSTIVEDTEFEKITGRARCQSAGGDTSSSKDSQDNSSLEGAESDEDVDALYDGFKEIPLPKCSETHFHHSFNFGRSFLADYNDEYMPDFVLHGTPAMNFKEKMIDDLKHSVECSALDEEIAESVCIVADTDTWSCEMYIANNNDARNEVARKEISASPLVSAMLNSVKNLRKLFPPYFCMMHLEDCLSEIFLKSTVLSQYITANASIKEEQISRHLGFDKADLPLLYAVAKAGPQMAF